jgi:hypothetical protein
MPEYNADQRSMKEALSIIPVALFTKIEYNKINDEETVNKVFEIDLILHMVCCQIIIFNINYVLFLLCRHYKQFNF